jgi:hypothetical protein
MDFEKAVSLVGTLTDLRRIARTHVIDNAHLWTHELGAPLAKQRGRNATGEVP